MWPYSSSWPNTLPVAPIGRPMTARTLRTHQRPSQSHGEAVSFPWMRTPEGPPCPVVETVGLLFQQGDIAAFSTGLTGQPFRQSIFCRGRPIKRDGHVGLVDPLQWVISKSLKRRHLNETAG